eukprot:superscaffoldBa00003101_g16123
MPVLNIYNEEGYDHFAMEVLSADRVEQMTKTYNDIEVVTHLLAERDRDLELAARIGQSLLQRNHLLQERNEAIEEQLAQALDQVHQLQHELSKKDELLRMVASASEESETDSSVSTPLRQPQPPGAAAAAAALSQLECLQSKLQDLEEENLMLRSEACQLKRDTITYEEKEQQLVSDCVKELRESNTQMVSLTDELSQKNEELLRHQEEIAQLLSQIVELQHRVKELALEKEELRIHLQASKDAQRQLTAELNELSERNIECVEMLHESQEEIKELRSKNAPSTGMRRHLSYGLYPMDSLAAEIEGTMRRELSVDEETAFENQRLFVLFVVCSVQNPGKCQSITFSTYTFTTCRILHPSDVTQVTPSSQLSLMANTPSSMRTGPSTPVTPCRLSLGDSFPPRRVSAPVSSLTKLVLERGISAQVSTDTPPSSPRPTTRQPLFHLLPSTPPNSPSHSPVPSPVPMDTRHHPADNFLASRPAELFLQDVYGLNLGRAPHPDLPSPSQETPALAPPPKSGRPRLDSANVGLVERLRRLGFTKVLQGADSEAPMPRQDSATFVSAGGGSLLDGLRRNQSLPAMIGAGARAGKSAGNPTLPPSHPTSLALPPPPWHRHLTSVSHHPPPGSAKR